MLRKWKKFFNKPADKIEIKQSNNTRIERRPETTKLLLFIDKLREKEEQLRKDALDKGPDSLDYKKHTIVANMLSQVDRKINAFNEEMASNNEYDEIKSIVDLAQDLLNIIEKTVTDHSETLQKQRDYHIEAARHSLDVGACGVVYGAATVAGLSSLGTGFALVAAAPKLSRMSKNALGLLKPSSATSALLLELQTSLKQMIDNLSFTLQLLKPEEVKERKSLSP